MMNRRYKGQKGYAWEALSLYIRERDEWTCITCNTAQRGTQTHAGHFESMGECGSNNKLGWDETNIYAQCEYCNITLKGNKEKFEEVLIQRYGKEFVQNLTRRKYLTDPVTDWYDMEIYYRQKLIDLKNVRNTQKKNKEGNKNDDSERDQK